MEICLQISDDVLVADKTQLVVVRSVSASRHHSNELVQLQLCYSDTKELVGDHVRTGCLTSSPVSGKDCSSGVYFRTSSTEAGKEAVFNLKIHALSSQHDNRKFCFKAFVNGFAPSYSGSFKTLSKIDRKRRRSGSVGTFASEYSGSSESDSIGEDGDTICDRIECYEFTEDFLDAFQEPPDNSRNDSDVINEFRHMKDAFTSMGAKYDDLNETMKQLMETIGRNNMRPSSGEAV